MSQHLESKEDWKDIPMYEGRYMISNNGNVKSLSIEKKNINGSFLTKERVLVPILKNGYFSVGLFKDRKNSVKYVHRLVAGVFISNDSNKLQVNHKNGIKTDNRVSNLEWSTPKENVEHSVLTGLKKSAIGASHGHYGKFGSLNHTSKKVIQIDSHSNLVIKVYGAISEASRETGIQQSGISKACNGGVLAGNYKWEYFNNLKP